jgi:hypothetical protein
MPPHLAFRSTKLRTANGAANQSLSEGCAGNLPIGGLMVSRQADPDCRGLAVTGSSSALGPQPTILRMA